MQSRLAEIRSKRRASTGEEQQQQQDVVIEMQERGRGEQAYMGDFRRIKVNLESIRENAKKVYALRQKADVQVRDSEEAELTKQLDVIMAQTKKQASEVKKLLEKQEGELQDSGNRANAHSTTLQIRQNLLSTHTRQFNTAMREFQDASESFKEALRQRIGRQARILKQDITEEELEEVISSKNPGQFMKEAMGLSDTLVDAVAELEERHERMKRIERGVAEIYELFQDLATLVELQQEHLDNIERNVGQTKNYVLEGEVQIRKAEAYQKSSRKMMCCFIGLLVVVGLVVVIMFAT